MDGGRITLVERYFRRAAYNQPTIITNYDIRERVIYGIIRRRGFKSDRSVLSPMYMCNLNSDKALEARTGCGNSGNGSDGVIPRRAPDIRGSFPAFREAEGGTAAL